MTVYLEKCASTGCYGKPIAIGRKNAAYMYYCDTCHSLIVAGDGKEIFSGVYFYRSGLDAIDCIDDEEVSDENNK